MHNKKAFTILEIVIAMAVLFIGLIGILSLFPSSARMADLSRVTTHMTLLGQSKLDELVGIRFNDLPDTLSDTISTADLNRLVANESVRPRLDTTLIEIENIAQNPLNSRSVLKELRVIVRYALKPGKFRETTFRTFVSNMGHG